jgi:hypothetical protein
MNKVPGTIPESFSLGIDLDNWQTCHNFSLAGTISSTEVAVSTVPAGTFPSVKTMDLDAFRRGETGTGMLSPRFANRILMPLKATGRLDAIGEIELEFEKKRRQLAPDTPSRLSCMWLAEDSEAGRSHIGQMFSTTRRLYVVRVRVFLALAFRAAHTGWFDQYVEKRDEESIANYWGGLSCPADGWLTTLSKGEYEKELERRAKR